MSEKITMVGALANAGIKNGDKVLVDFLVENIEGIKSKQMFTGPGIKNALDWQIIINTVSFVSGIATVIGKILWEELTCLRAIQIRVFSNIVS